ncbi:MAG: peptidoglycan-binding protein [Patescibacteria group bacterium]
MLDRPLFPPRLDLGSFGGAVDALHMLLDGYGFGEGIVPDLEYGPNTAKSVRALQTHLGFTGEDVDGNFGPATRAALKKQHGFDVDRIGWAPQNGITLWFDTEGNHRCWPPAPPMSVRTA